MFTNFKRINSNEFTITFSHGKYQELEIKCSSICNRSSNIPHYVCSEVVRNEIRVGIIKISQVLDGMYGIEILDYKKYDGIREDVRKELKNYD